MSLCSCGHEAGRHELITNGKDYRQFCSAKDCPCPAFKPVEDLATKAWKRVGKHMRSALPLAQEAEKQEAPDIYICRCCNQPRIQCTSGLCDCPPNLQPVPQQVELSELEEIANILGFEKVGKKRVKFVSYYDDATSTNEVDETHRVRAILAWKDREVAKALNQPKRNPNPPTNGSKVV